MPKKFTVSQLERGVAKAFGITKKRRRRKAKFPRQLIPNVTHLRFKYAEQISLDPGAGTAASHTFSANGCYDPNISGTGHQPLGFDQYVGVMYDHYTVLKSRITIKANTTGGTAATGNMLFGVMLRDTSSSTPVIPDAFIEQGRVKYANISATGQNAKTISYTANPLKFLNHEKTDDDVRGSASGNPPESAYWIVWASATNGTDNAAPLDVMVVIDYWVELSEPRTLGQS